MNWHRVGALVRKDLKIILRNKGVRIPLIVTPILLLFVLPAFLVTGSQLLAQSDLAQTMDETGPFQGFLPSVQEQVGDEELTWERTVLEFLTAPLFLLVPLVVATVVAADSFAGERERRTLEGLLHSPTTDDELFMGKLLVAYLPAVAVALVAFAGYSVWSNLLGYQAIGRIFFPTLMWVVLALWVAPALSLLGLGLMVVVSSRVRSLQAAHQIGSLVILPFVLILVAQVTGLLSLNASIVIAFGSLVWMLAGIVLLRALRTFERDRMASRL
jgi:ABC-2 type transport system permease protein